MLHLAVLHNHVAMATLLLTMHVNIDAQDHQGMTPLALALQHRLDDCIRLLIQNGAGTTPPLGRLTGSPPTRPRLDVRV